MLTLIVSLALLFLGGTNGFSQSLKAACGPDLSIVLGQPVHFDGTLSRTAPGHRIETWNWDFDNMDEVHGNHEGPELTYYYNQVGAYTATLTVKDDMGQIDQS